MLSSSRILVSHANHTARKVSPETLRLPRLALLGACVFGLAACGQQGPLYLPTEPAAANRATLLQTLLPRSGPDAALQSPAPAPAASAAATPPSAPPSR